MRDEAEFFAPISREIWDLKYRLKSPDGGAIDSSLDDTFWRVARAAASAEKGGKKAREKWAKRFHDAIADFGFLPAGRILAGAGTDRNVTLFNCFVLGEIEDDLSAIFENVKDAALTMQQGGGIGHDFSTLRPKGALVAKHRRRRLRPGQLHGRVGRHVPHHHVGRQPARRHDGDAALRPSRHRGLHRRQGRAGAPAQFQSVGAGDGRFHRRRARRRAVGPEVRRQGLSHAAGARPVGPHHARDLRLRRAGRRLHRPRQCAQQPHLLRDDPRHQSLRRAAAAAVRRLPAGLDQSRAPHRQSVHRQRHARPRQAGGAGRPSPCASSTTSSTSRTIRSRRSARRRRPSGASASASPALPMR